MAYPVALRDWLMTLLARCPSDCPLCLSQAHGGFLCGGCADEVGRSMRTVGPRCKRCCLVLDAQGGCHDCQRAAPVHDGVLAAFDYSFPGSLLIHQLKQQRRFVLAKMLSGLLVRQIRSAQLVLPGDTILLPVPSSRASLGQRGFSPAAELARHLARGLGLRCRTDMLFRLRDSAPQKQLNRAQRAAGTQRLYGCSPRVLGQHVALVDDVMTTGSTLNALALVLKQAGARSVFGLVLARTPLRERID